MATYDLEHRLGSGDWETLLAGTTLTETTYVGLEGTHSFRVLARDGAHNPSPYSAETSTVVDVTDPAADLAEIVESSPYAHVAGDTAYYGPGSGSFEVQVAASDATSGLDRAEYPAAVSAGGVYTQALGGAYQYGHVYTFTPSSTEEGGYQATVYDRAGNLSAVPFAVTRDAISPTVAITAPARSGVVTVTVTWSGDDGDGSGIASYDLEVSEDGGDWTRLLTATQATSYEHAGEYGHSYTFRVQATDNVSNVGDWAQAATTIVQVTKYYAFGGQRIALRRNSV